MPELTDCEILDLFHRMPASDRAAYIKDLQDLLASQEQPHVFPAAKNE